MDVDFRKYEKYRNDLRFMVVCLGLWPNHDKHPKAFRRFLRLVAGLTSGITSCLVLLFFIKNATNILAMTRGLSLLVSFFSVFFKICILSLHQDNLEILDGSVSMNFERNLKISEHRPHLLSQLPTFSRLFYALNYCLFIACTMQVTTPLLMLKHGKYVRVYPLQFPFTYDQGGTIHWSIYGFELLSGFYLWWVTCCIDSFFGLYAFHIVGELRLLSSRFQNLRTSENYKKELKECIDGHTLLMEAKKTLEEVFGFLSIWLAVTCAVCLCALVFQVSAMKHFTPFIVCYLIFYVILKLVQAFSYAWFGNIITVESKRCLDSIYNAHWLECTNTQFMSDVLVVLSQKPLIFKAKNVMLLDLDIFTKIVNTTISYFFLLQTLEESFEVSS